MPLLYSTTLGVRAIWEARTNILLKGRSCWKWAGISSLSFQADGSSWSSRGGHERTKQPGRTWQMMEGQCSVFLLTDNRIICAVKKSILLWRNIERAPGGVWDLEQCSPPAQLDLQHHHTPLEDWEALNAHLEDKSQLGKSLPKEPGSPQSGIYDRMGVWCSKQSMLLE